MPSQNLDSLKTELSVAIRELVPQIDGLGDLYVIHFSDAVKSLISRDLARHNRRLGLCQVALEALETLAADGFPTMTKVQVSTAAINELTAEVSALDAAIGGFVGEDPASELRINLGQPQPKD